MAPGDDHPAGGGGGADADAAGENAGAAEAGVAEAGAPWRDEATVGEGGYDSAPGVRAAAKRGPGRPRGAVNRKTAEFEKLYRAKGFKDPLLFLGEVISRDPVELQAWYVEHERAIRAQGKHLYLAIPTLHEIEAMQIAAADKLKDHLHGKMPAQIVVSAENLPHLIIDLGTHQLADAAAIAGRKALSAGAPMIEATANKINDLRADRNATNGDGDPATPQPIENKRESDA